MCYAGLQLEVAERIVTAARREELGCKSYRRASWEAAQIRVKKEVAQMLREEVAETRGTSAKGSLSGEVAQQRSSSLIHPTIHPSIHLFTQSLIHWFINSLIHSFVDSLIH